MKSLEVHEAEARLAELVAEVEQTGAHVVICRNGKPVADLVPHLHDVPREPDPVHGARTLNYDPGEELSTDDWPDDNR